MANESQLRSNSLTSIGFATKSIVEDDERINRTALIDDDANQRPFEANSLESENHSIPRDVVCFLCICEQHQAILLQKILNDCYFFPSNLFDDSTQPWAELIRFFLGLILPSIDPNLLRSKLIDIYRVQMPKTQLFIQRFLFRIVLVPNSNDSNTVSPPCICDPTKIIDDLSVKEKQDDVVWLSISSIPHSLANIWGGELIRYFYNSNWQTGTILDELNLFELDSELPNRVLESNSMLQGMNESVSYFASSIVYLFNEFVVHCFPSNSMNFSSFTIFCDKLGWTANTELRMKLFRSIDRQNRRYISYEDLLEGLILFESSNEISDISYRHGYIFRYYDSNWDNRLELEEFRHLFIDYYNSNHFETLLIQLNQTREDYMKQMIENTWNNFVERNSDSNCSFEQYLSAFEQINQSIGSRVSWLPMLGFFDQIAIRFNCRNFATTSIQKIVDAYLYYIRCEVCMAKRFSLSSCFLDLTEVGTIYKIHRFKPNPEISQINFVDEFPEKNILVLANEFIIRTEKVAYNRSTDELIDHENSTNFFFPTKRSMIHYLYLILDNVKKLIDNDPKFIEVASPATVIGDLNGSLEDLLRLGHSIFRTFPFFEGNAAIFLGNYTDPESNLNNLECLIYVFCMKILYPNRVFLLRGAQELSTCAQFLDKDNPDEPLNNQCCNLIQQIFESMPLAATIDDQIFAAHSGIPTNMYAISRMKMICEWHKSMIANPRGSNTRNVNNVENSDNFIISELLMKELLQLISNEPIMGPNPPSANDTASFQFTNKELDSFLNCNKMFCMIRSSNPNMDYGFNFNPHFNLVTIVTSNKKSKIGCTVLIDQGRIRLLRFDGN